MNITAKYSREWRSRMGIILLMIAGSSGWFFYDGLVAYPKFNRGAEAYAQIRESVAADGFAEAEADAEAAKRWEARAADFDGDSKEPPKHPKNVAQQIHFGVGLGVLALAFLAWVLREMRRVVRADDEKFDGLTTAFPPFNGSVPVRFDSVFGVDRRKWKNKGIAVIHYKNGRGRPCRVLVDDYKYAGSEAILEKCEAVVAEKQARKSAAGNAVPAAE